MKVFLLPHQSSTCHASLSSEKMQRAKKCVLFMITTWKESKYGVFCGSYFPAFGLNTGKHKPEKTPYLNTFHAVDASAKANDQPRLLNQCLKPEPNLRNLIWGILVWSRFKLILVYGDLKQAFLQICILESCRDA